MNDFWIACGHHLLDRNSSGGLVVTDEFLKAYFARRELMPPHDACATERRLHSEMLADPRRLVGADKIASIVDNDARENWQFVLGFRDLLLRHRTLEAAYLSLVRSGSNSLPPLFVNQFVHVICVMRWMAAMTPSCFARPNCSSGRSEYYRMSSCCFSVMRRSSAGAVRPRCCR